MNAIANAYDTIDQSKTLKIGTFIRDSQSR
jgi:hypothetical protein